MHVCVLELKFQVKGQSCPSLSFTHSLLLRRRCLCISVPWSSSFRPRSMGSKPLVWFRGQPEGTPLSFLMPLTPEASDGWTYGSWGKRLTLNACGQSPETVGRPLTAFPSSFRMVLRVWFCDPQLHEHLAVPDRGSTRVPDDACQRADVSEQTTGTGEWF